MAYNMTALQDATTVGKLFVFANNSTGGVLSGLMMLAVFFIMLFSLKRWEFGDALLASSFVCFILSAVLSYAGLLNLLFTLGFLAIMSLTAFYMFVVKKS